jgi:hypothetical protein
MPLLNSLPLKYSSKIRRRNAAASGGQAAGPRAAGSELIFFDAHRGLSASAPHYNAFNKQREPNAIVKKHRPVYKGFNDLPWLKGFGRLEDHALAADIQALAYKDSGHT